MKLIAKFISCILLGVVCAAYTGNLLAEPEKQISPYQPKPQPEKSFEELKNNLERTFRNTGVFKWHNGDKLVAYFYYRDVETFGISDDAISVTFKRASVFDKSISPSEIDYTFHIRFDEFAEVLRDGACTNPESLDPNSGIRYSVKFSIPRKINGVSFSSEAFFREACDAMYNMGLRYQEKELQEEARFNELATRYRALKTKPALTEQQRRLVVQANALTQERNYYDAMDRYRQLLADDPVIYPVAYYNMALLSAELKLYKRAIRHMNRYLALVPEANDARAAQDKIYEWELKAEGK